LWTPEKNPVTVAGDREKWAQSSPMEETRLTYKSNSGLWRSRPEADLLAFVIPAYAGIQLYQGSGFPHSRE